MFVLKCKIDFLEDNFKGEIIEEVLDEITPNEKIRVVCSI